MVLLRYPSLLNEIDRLLDKSFRPEGEDDSSSVATSKWAPAVDIKEEADRFIILADLPGLETKDISITMDNNVLAIQGERVIEKNEEKENFSRVERVRGSFHRRFTLPDTADSENIQASMKKGVLEVVVPKRELAKPRMIEITSHD